MNLTDGRLFFLLAMVLVISLPFILRRRRPEVTRPRVVQDLLSETRLNQALLDFFRARQEPKKLMATSWRRNQTRLDFLDQSLQKTLADAFMMAEDFNQQLAVTKKYQSASALISFNVDKLKELLAKSREGLEQWLLRNVGSKELPPQYPSILDSLFGRRD